VTQITRRTHRRAHAQLSLRPSHGPRRCGRDHDGVRWEGQMNQHCACVCGASHFSVEGDPIARFFCHCTICRERYRKPFADVTYFWAGSVTLPPNQAHRVSPLPPAACNEARDMREMPQSPCLACWAAGWRWRSSPHKLSRGPASCLRQTDTSSMIVASRISPTIFQRSAAIGRARCMSPSRFSPGFLHERALPDRAAREI
jgi:hypothetical protein